MGNVYMDFEGMIQLLIGYSAFVGQNMGVQQDSTMYKLRLSLPTPRSTCFDLGTKLRLVVTPR